MAGIHHRHQIRLCFQLGQGMGTDQDAGTPAFQHFHQIVEMGLGGWVETGGGLVQQQNLRPADQRLGEAQSLSHAFGISFDPFVERLGKPHCLQQCQTVLERFPLQAGEEFDNLGPGHIAVKHDIFRQIAHIET